MRILPKVHSIKCRQINEEQCTNSAKTERLIIEDAWDNFETEQSIPEYNNYYEIIHDQTNRLLHFFFDFLKGVKLFFSE